MKCTQARVCSWAFYFLLLCLAVTQRKLTRLVVDGAVN